jgi:hypothetical protein
MMMFIQVWLIQPSELYLETAYITLVVQLKWLIVNSSYTIL